MSIKNLFLFLVAIFCFQSAHASMSCAYSPGQLKSLLRASGNPTSMAKSILGRWSKSSDSEGFYFFVHENVFFMAGSGPFGKDAQPLAVCKQSDSSKSEFVIVGSYKGIKKNISVRFSGGKKFSVSSPRSLKGNYALRDSDPRSVFSDAGYAAAIKKATR